MNLDPTYSVGQLAAALGVSASYTYGLLQEMQWIREEKQQYRFTRKETRKIRRYLDTKHKRSTRGVQKLQKDSMVIL